MALLEVGTDTISSRPFVGSPSEYLSNVLKSQFGNSGEFLEFERYFYYQCEELNSTKSASEQLRATVSKLEEEKRSLQLQLITAKALREQESKTAAIEIEKANVQQNAQIYTLKCEVESWKRKTEAVNAESTWLKDQMKTVEMEKNQVVLKLTELRSRMNDFERNRQSVELYGRRLRESIIMANKRLEDVEAAKESLAKLVDSNQQQIGLMSMHLRNWNEERLKSQKKISELENEVIKAKAALVQNNAVLVRAEMSEKKTAELVDQLIAENKDLHNGLAVLAKTFGEQSTKANEDFSDKINRIRVLLHSSAERLTVVPVIQLRHARQSSPRQNPKSHPNDVQIIQTEHSIPC